MTSNNNYEPPIGKPLRDSNYKIYGGSNFIRDFNNALNILLDKKK